MQPKSLSHQTMGGILKAIRLQQNRTLQDLTRDLNIDTSGLSRVERGLQGFPQDTLVSLLGYYGIDLPALLISAAGLTEADIEEARRKSKVQKPEVAPEETCEAPTDDGWLDHNPVLSSRQYAGHTMLLCRRSFEKPEFELIFMGRVRRGIQTIQAAKNAAPDFARKVLRDESQAIGS
ncbi:TPA: helix-turn-helix transcriptional regulator [Pseudomonas aeruginosa]|nr:helix-turn-helix transcriptional regulator [Pseudomonas aeruginosa]